MTGEGASQRISILSVVSLGIYFVCSRVCSREEEGRVGERFDGTGTGMNLIFVLDYFIILGRIQGMEYEMG